MNCDLVEVRPDLKQPKRTRHAVRHKHIQRSMVYQSEQNPTDNKNGLQVNSGLPADRAAGECDGYVFLQNEILRKSMEVNKQYKTMQIKVPHKPVATTATQETRHTIVTSASPTQSALKTYNEAPKLHRKVTIDAKKGQGSRSLRNTTILNDGGNQWPISHTDCQTIASPQNNLFKSLNFEPTSLLGEGKRMSTVLQNTMSLSRQGSMRGGSINGLHVKPMTQSSVLHRRVINDRSELNTLKKNVYNATATLNSSHASPFVPTQPMGTRPLLP